MLVSELEKNPEISISMARDRNSSPSGASFKQVWFFVQNELRWWRKNAVSTRLCRHQFRCQRISSSTSFDPKKPSASKAYPTNTSVSAVPIRHPRRH